MVNSSFQETAANGSANSPGSIAYQTPDWYPVCNLSGETEDWKAFRSRKKRSQRGRVRMTNALTPQKRQNRRICTAMGIVVAGSRGRRPNAGLKKPKIGFGNATSYMNLCLYERHLRRLLERSEDDGRADFLCADARTTGAPRCTSPLKRR
jgi:hypothetical protein